MHFRHSILLPQIYPIPWCSHSWEANRFSASQEIPCILWNPKIHYRIHKCPPPAPVLGQLDPVHTPTPHFLKIRPIILLPYRPGSTKWSLSLRRPHQNPLYASSRPHTCYMPRPSHSGFYHPSVPHISTLKLNLYLRPYLYVSIVAASNYLHFTVERRYVYCKAVIECQYSWDELCVFKGHEFFSNKL